MKKKIMSVLALILIAASLAGCSRNTGSDLEYVQKKGTLIVGITEYAPMDYKDENGEWTGFDAELARMVGDELGVEVEFFLLSDWGQKFNELNTKNIDCIWNGMTISQEVLANTSCSDPYVINAQVVVMKKDKVGDYQDAESLKDLEFAVEVGSTGKDALDDAGLTNYIEVKDMATALMEVSAGTADACVIDITMAKAMTGEGTSYADLAQGISLSSEEYGIAFRKDSDLTDRVNELIAQFKADGSLQALAEKYSLTLTD